MITLYIEVIYYFPEDFLKYDIDYKSFKRALFELDRLDYNIGIYIPNEVTNLFNNIKGFKIKLGVWLNEDKYRHLQNELNSYKSFITGIISEDNFRSLQMPRWGTMGDIENSELIKLDFIREPIQQLIINTDFVKIYDENELKPIPSFYNV